MAHTLTATELSNQSVGDLQHDIAEHRMMLRKMRINITMNTEKDTAKYRRERKVLARMLTVLSKKKKESLSTSEKTSTVSARRSSAASAAKKTPSPKKKAKAA